MNTILLITAICCFLVVVNGHSKIPQNLPDSLDEFTNYVRPVHGDVKTDDNALTQKLRVRRDVSGSLDIVTNNAQPIHAEVKTDNNADKPCSDPKKPSRIEQGVVFKVVPPNANSDLMFIKSLRKSLPVTNKLDLIRSMNRIVVLVVLVATVVIELYPTLAQLISTIYNFMLE